MALSNHLPAGFSSNKLKLDGETCNVESRIIASGSGKVGNNVNVTRNYLGSGKQEIAHTFYNNVLDCMACDSSHGDQRLSWVNWQFKFRMLQRYPHCMHIKDSYSRSALLEDVGLRQFLQMWSFLHRYLTMILCSITEANRYQKHKHLSYVWIFHFLWFLWRNVKHREMLAMFLRWEIPVDNEADYIADYVLQPWWINPCAHYPTVKVLEAAAQGKAQPGWLHRPFLWRICGT